MSQDSPFSISSLTTPNKPVNKSTLVSKSLSAPSTGSSKASGSSKSSKSACNSTTPLSSKAKKRRSRHAPYIPSYLEVDQKCVVCGDKATGLHYQAITCEGCKGFFRRSAQKKLIYDCKEEGQKRHKCPVDINTRNLCQGCRYKKCISSGMSTALVLNEAERSAKRCLISANREKRNLDRQLVEIRRRIPLVPINEARTLIDTVTGAYITWLEGPLSLDVNFIHQNPKEQYNGLLMKILGRTFGFMKTFAGFENIPLSQLKMFVCEFNGWLEVQVLRAVLNMRGESCLLPASVNVGFEQPVQLASLKLSNNFLSILSVIAKSFYPIEITNEEIALLVSVLMLPKCFIDNNPTIATQYNRLWETLESLVHQNGEIIGNEQPMGIVRFPLLISAVTMLQRIVAKHAKELIEVTNAREIARLFM